MRSGRRRPRFPAVSGGLALAILVAAAAAASARVGETKAEIEARYGEKLRDMKAAPPATSAAMFEKNSFRIVVYFQDGVSVLEYAVRWDASEGRLVQLGQPDIESFLAANAGASSWPDTGLERTRNDGRMVAIIDAARMLMTVTTKEFAEAREKAGGGEPSPF